MERHCADIEGRNGRGKCKTRVGEVLLRRLQRLPVQAFINLAGLFSKQSPVNSCIFG